MRPGGDKGLLPFNAAHFLQYALRLGAALVLHPFANGHGTDGLHAFRSGCVGVAWPALTHTAFHSTAHCHNDKINGHHRGVAPMIYAI
jgi:hypothetical protein